MLLPQRLRLHLVVRTEFVSEPLMQLKVFFRVLLLVRRTHQKSPENQHIVSLATDVVTAFPYFPLTAHASSFCLSVRAL